MKALKPVSWWQFFMLYAALGPGCLKRATDLDNFTGFLNWRISSVYVDLFCLNYFALVFQQYWGIKVKNIKYILVKGIYTIFLIHNFMINQNC